MRVSIIEGQGFATDTLKSSLCRHFGQANVSSIKQDEIIPSTLRHTDLLVLPGISSEKSPYPDIISPPKAELVRKKMEQDGLIVYAECAAFYWCSSHISYHASSGEMLEKDGLGWIDGVAKGPKKGIAPSQNFRYADTTIANISFPEGQDTGYTQICISNGPALYLTEEETANTNVAVTSRFICEEQMPVATMNKIMGHGLLVGMGVLPHIRTAQVGHTPLRDRQHELHRQVLFNALTEHDNNIDRFENIIFQGIKNHHASVAGNKLEQVMRHAEPT